MVIVKEYEAGVLKNIRYDLTPEEQERLERSKKKCKFCKGGKAKYSKSFVITTPICKFCAGNGWIYD